jgi:beclin 1
MGSCSKIEKISDKTVFELFGSSDISLGRLFWYRRFDNGMAAFLSCIEELGEFIENKDNNLKLPYPYVPISFFFFFFSKLFTNNFFFFVGVFRISKDKIGEMSVKIQFNNEETWTKALKYMLTDLKYLLIWLVRQEALNAPIQQPKYVT